MAAGFHLSRLADSQTSSPREWVTVRKPKERFSASVSVIAVIKKETVRTPKDPDHCLGLGTRELG